ncbi:MAG: hypothetical protein LBU40_03290 [Methanobrevibacter sp.]|jgi:hypothetical protein|nr:hypothetical protein [Methanobrevibacter sp.]
MKILPINKLLKKNKTQEQNNKKLIKNNKKAVEENKKTIKNNKIFKINNKGLIINDLMIGVVVLVVLLGIMSFVISSSNEKILNSLEKSELESKNIETINNLVKNPGSPNNWEILSNIDNINPGLAIINGENKTILNSVNYEKFLRLRDNYRILMKNKVFHGDIKSSIYLKPLDTDLNTITIGDSEILENPNNIISNTRLVKCDFYSKFKLISFEKNMLNNEQKDQCINMMNINIMNINNQTNPIHQDNNQFIWVCKNFKINSDNLSNMDYYLLIDEDSVEINSYWTLNTMDNINTGETHIIGSSYYLNNEIENLLNNTNEKVYYLHLKIDKNNVDNFNGILIAVPKNFNINDIPIQNKIKYFQIQNCQVTLKTWF